MTAESRQHHPSADLARPDAHPADFHLDGWFIRPVLGTAERNGVAVHLRPQLADLLVFLARRGGRVASRDEIRAAVWPRHFVADTALPRCVAELRRVLGDDARRPRVIETINKRGYRVVAPVRWLDQPVAAAPASVTPAGRSGPSRPSLTVPPEPNGSTPSPPVSRSAGLIVAASRWRPLRWLGLLVGCLRPLMGTRS